MAYDKIIVIRSRLDCCLNYVQNEAKTDLANAADYICNPTKAGLQTAINCSLEHAFSQMQETKRRWDKCGGILGYHIVHSYAPGEVTPEQVHEGGVEFANRLLGNRYEAVVCTHTDRSHLHCHIVFNSVSFVDGRKYRSDFKSYFHDLRDASNAVSRERGFSVIASGGQGTSYSEWSAARNGKTTVRGLVRQDIDAALAGSFTQDTFWESLRRQGYSIKRGANVMHTALKPPGGLRFIRLDSLGAEYTEEAILQRLRKQRGEVLTMLPPTRKPKYYRIRCKPNAFPTVKRGSFRALYLYYLYLLSPRKKRPQKVPFETRTEIRRVKQYRQQFLLLQKYRIDTKPELELLSEALANEMQILIDRRKALYALRHKQSSEQLETDIAALTARLRPLRRELRLCGRIAETVLRMLRQVEETRQTKSEQHAPEAARERRQSLWR